MTDYQKLEQEARDFNCGKSHVGGPCSACVLKNQLADAIRDLLAERDGLKEGFKFATATSEKINAQLAEGVVGLQAENRALREDAEKWRDAVKKGTALQDEARRALAAQEKP